MTARVFRAFRAEASKALRARGTYAGPAVLAAAAAASAGMTLAQGVPLGYAYIAYATGISYGLAGLPLILAYASTGIAGDVHSGSVRLMLTRPLKRYEYVLGKFLLAYVYGLALLLASAAAAWGAAAWFGSIGGVAYGGEVVYTAREMQLAYLGGAALSCAPAAAATAYGLLWSAALRSPAAALAGSVGSWVILDAVKYPLGIDRALFWSYWTFPWEDFRSRSDALPFDGGEHALLTLAVSGAWFLVCLSAAAAVFQRRNL